MMVNLLVICLNYFVKKKDTTITFQHLELPNKMFLGESRKHLLLCFKSCYFKTRVKKDFLRALEMEKT